MTTEKFKAGDTVLLNSGSPIMTIEEITNVSRNAKCIWFIDGKKSDGFFPLECLKITVAQPINGF